MASERTFACRGGEYFADGKPIDPLLELVELEAELERLRGEVRKLKGVCQHNKPLWGVCGDCGRLIGSHARAADGSSS